MKVKNELVKKIVLFFMLNIIALKFIMIADDYIFANLTINNMFEFVFSSSGNETYIIKNGRYLGNLLGILMSMTYKLGNLKYIRGIFMGSGIFILIFLCSKLSKLEKEKSFIVATLLILLAPVSIYAQVYSWTSAYMNYLVPTILFILILLIFDKYINKDKKIKNKDIFLLILLGLSCQLFMENITIYICFFSLFLLMYSIFKNKDLTKMTVPFFISTLLGAIIMFSCKGYRQINTSDSYRSIDISNLYAMIKTVIFNGWNMTRYIILDNFVLIAVILVLCFIIIKKSSCNYNKIFSNSVVVMIIYMCIYLFINNILDLATIPRRIRMIKYIFDTVVAVGIVGVIGYTIFKYIKNKDLKKRLYFYCISIIIVSLPLLIVSPISTRCFFICYIFLLMICLDITKYILENRFIILKRINLIAMALIIVIFIDKYYIFNSINNQFNDIVSYTKEQMVEKKDIVLLPEFKFKQYLHSDIAIFIGFLYYYNIPNDIKFKTIDYDEWEKITSNK